jgi:hypothetical protein
MSLGHGPKIVTSDLRYYLDPNGEPLFVPITQEEYEANT